MQGCVYGCTRFKNVKPYLWAKDFQANGLKLNSNVNWRRKRFWHCRETRLVDSKFLVMGALSGVRCMWLVVLNNRNTWARHRQRSHYSKPGFEFVIVIACPLCETLLGQQDTNSGRNDAPHSRRIGNGGGLSLDSTEPATCSLTVLCPLEPSTVA